MGGMDMASMMGGMGGGDFGGIDFSKLGGADMGSMGDMDDEDEGEDMPKLEEEEKAVDAAGDSNNVTLKGDEAQKAAGDSKIQEIN